MKATAALALAMSLLAAAHAADDAASAPADAAVPLAAASDASVVRPERAILARITPQNAGFCLYSDTPTGNARYTALDNIKSKRGTYGSVTDELPRFVDMAQAAGADAVIHYSGGQHFGFWPWRITRPILQGVPIKFDEPAPDCAASGGATFATVMRTNKEPPKHAKAASQP